MFNMQGLSTVSGCPKLPVAENGPMDGVDDDLEKVCGHTHTYMYLHTHKHKHLHTYTHLHTQTHTHTHMQYMQTHICFPQPAAKKRKIEDEIQASGGACSFSILHVCIPYYNIISIVEKSHPPSYVVPRLSAHHNVPCNPVSAL